MYRDDENGSGPPSDAWATSRIILQATGVLRVRRDSSIPDADAYLSSTAQTMGVDRGILSRLIIDAVNARGGR